MRGSKGRTGAKALPVGGRSPRWLWTAGLAAALSSASLAFPARAEDPALVQDRVQGCVAVGRARLPDRDALARDVRACARELELDCLTGHLGLVGPSGRPADRYECWDAQVAAWSQARRRALDNFMSRASTLEARDAQDRADLGRAATAADEAWDEAMRTDCKVRALLWTGSLRVTEPFACPLRAEVERTVDYLLWADDLQGG